MLSFASWVWLGEFPRAELRRRASWEGGSGKVLGSGPQLLWVPDTVAVQTVLGLTCGATHSVLDRQTLTNVQKMGTNF